MSEWFWKKLSFLAGIIAIVVLFGLIIYAANIEIKDLDLWLHLGMGKHILQTLSVPKVDILSCTIAGKSWINHEWFFQTILYLVYNTSGFFGLISLQVVVIGVTFAILLILGYNPEKQISQIVLLLLVLLVYQIRFTIRPDIFSLLYFVLYIYFLALPLDKKESLIALFFIQVLWTNSHGFFIFGPVLVFLVVTAEFIKKSIPLPFDWNKTGRLTKNEWKGLQRILLGVVIACFFNPHTVKGALYPLNVLHSISGESRIFFQHIGELQKPILLSNIFNFNIFPFYKYLIVISLVSFVINYRKLDVGMLLFWGIFLSFSLSATRNIPFFAFVAYFVTLVNIQYLSLNNQPILLFRSKRFQYVVATVFKMFLIMWMLQYGRNLHNRGYYDYDRYQRKSETGGISLRNYARKAVDFLVKNGIQGNFFNDFNSGAYLVGRTYPDIKVFIDGRTEVYGVEFYKEYRQVWMKGNWELFEELSEKYNITGAFINSIKQPAPRKTIQNFYKSDQWQLVYFDYDAAIFLKDIPQNKKWIDRFTIDLNQWEAPKTDLLRLGLFRTTPYRHMNRAKALYNLGFLQTAKGECLEALKIEPYNADAFKILGKIELSNENYMQAFEYLRKAKLFNPSGLEIRYHLARSFYHLGDISKAQQQCQIVLSGKPSSHKTLSLLALIYAQKKQYEKSYELVKEVVSLHPGEIDEIVKVAEWFEAQELFDWASKVYSSILKLEPENEEILEIINKINQRL